MPASPADWEKITPNELRPAIKRVRTAFDEGLFKWSETLRRLCSSHLHPGMEPVFTSRDEAALADYKRLYGAAAFEFDYWLEQASPSAIFKAFHDAYWRGEEMEVRYRFNEVLQIGVRHAEQLDLHPVAWAKAHLQLLIEKNAVCFKIWVRRVCDPDSTNSASSKWQAPKLIHMDPSGNTPFNPLEAWTREDEARTRALVEFHSTYYSERFKTLLEGLARDVRMRLRKPHQKVPGAAKKTELGKREPAKGRRSVVKPPNSKSVKMAAAQTAIASIWIAKAKVTHKQMLGLADRSRVPIPWKGPSTWVEAYGSGEARVKTLFSKARSQALSQMSPPAKWRPK